MKLFPFVVLVLFSKSVQGLEIATQFGKLTNVAIARWITEAVVDRLEKESETGAQLFSNFDSKVSILPKFAEPEGLESWEYPLDVTSEGFSSTGHFSLCKPAITGLSKVVDNFKISMQGGMTMKWRLMVPTTIKIRGPYKFSASINSTQLFGKESKTNVVSGEGEFLGSVDDVFMKLDSKITGKDGKLHLERLTMDLGFKTLRTDAKNTAVNDEPTNLDHFAVLFEKLFQSAWTAEIKDGIADQIKCAINDVIADCNFQDVLESKLGCLKFAIKEECFEENSGYFKFSQNEDAPKDNNGYCDKLSGIYDHIEL